ncbi:alcohol dehydrogenase catalytic domain-containing protein, partial [Ancrocorticia sp.]
MSFRGILIEQEVVKGKVLNHRAELRDLPESILGTEGARSSNAVGSLSSSGNTGAAFSGSTGAAENPGMAGNERPVDIDVLYSGVNYKDGLAVGGKPGVARTSPLIPGIDLVGRVRNTDNDRFASGELVVLTGGGIGESFHGGLAERARVPADYLMPVPDGLSASQAAAIGTAGFTAMLSVLTLEREGVAPETGPVIVMGAAGGVGSIAVAVLAQLGYEVTALSGRVESQSEYLRSLGATHVIDRQQMAEPGPPL